MRISKEFEEKKVPLLGRRGREAPRCRPVVVYYYFTSVVYVQLFIRESIFKPMDKKFHLKHLK